MVQLAQVVMVELVLKEEAVLLVVEVEAEEQDIQTELLLSYPLILVEIPPKQHQSHSDYRLK